MMPERILHMTGVDKSFGGVHALKGVDLELFAGEVLALVGENGAGKTTLMEILCGNVRPDAGEIRLSGQRVRFDNAHEAQLAGIGIVHQELSLVPYLSVAENIFCGREPVLPVIGFIDRRKMWREAQKLLDRFHLQVRPAQAVGELSVPVQQMVEIVKALSLDCKLLVLDEPTSALTERETALLYEIIRSLRQQGVPVIYISHKLSEVFEIADRIMVLRDGELVGVRRKEEVAPEDVVRMMVGRELTHMFAERGSGRGGVALKVEGLSRGQAFRDVSFALHEGEILGVSGLVGSGRTDLARTIFGVEPAQRGSIQLDGEPVRIRSPQRAIELGIGYVPEDRKEQGLFLDMTVRANVVSASLRQNAKAGVMSSRLEREHAAEFVERLRIRTPSVNVQTSHLSGGNQQKVLLAKWLAIRPRILLVDEPTRGIDVGAKAEIHFLLRELADAGVAVMMISSELPEILGASDRIMVMYEGRVTAMLSPDEATEETVMAYATGQRVQEDRAA